MSRSLAFLVGVVLVPLLASSAAHAAPTTSAPSGHRRSPALALGLSLGVTAAGLITFRIAGELDDEAETGLAIAGATAFVLGPSVGHWYSGRVVTAPMVIRLLSGTVATFMLAGSYGCSFGGGEDCDDGEEIVWIGYGICAAATIYEVVDAPFAARAYNRRHGLDVQIAPAPIAGARGVAPGLALLGRF